MKKPSKIKVKSKMFEATGEINSLKVIIAGAKKEIKYYRDFIKACEKKLNKLNK